MCFSKDRPLQLDGYLRSLREASSQPVRVRVLYTCSSDRFRRGYAELAESHPDVEFEPEHDFGRQLTGWLKATAARFVMFGCDDVVFCRAFDVAQIAGTFNDYDLLGFSLRLGRNIEYSHSRREAVPHPEFKPGGDKLVWCWRSADSHWAYPFELNCTVYERSMTLRLVAMMEQLRIAQPPFDWRHPNLLELAGNTVLKSTQGPSLMASFGTSRAVVPTVNRVQNLVGNRLMGGHCSTEALEEARNAGARLDLEAYRACSFDRIHVGEFFVANRPTARPVVLVS